MLVFHLRIVDAIKCYILVFIVNDTIVVSGQCSDLSCCIQVALIVLYYRDEKTSFSHDSLNNITISSAPRSSMIARRSSISSRNKIPPCHDTLCLT